MPEGKLVRDTDRVEMMVQCLRYELSGSRGWMTSGPAWIGTCGATRCVPTSTRG